MELRDKIKLVKEGRIAELADEMVVSRPSRQTTAQKSGRRKAASKLRGKKQSASAVSKRSKSLSKNLRTGKRSVATLRKKKFG